MLIRKLLIGLSSVFALSVAACAADTSDDADDDEIVAEDESELSAAGKALIGSYVDDTGAFRGLVLTSVKHGARNEFWADVDTGIRCITAPCPSSERIEGTFTAGSKTITLRSTTAQHSQHLLGTYRYLKQGDKLTLFRKGFSQSLAKQLSYCAQPADCKNQGLPQPRCIGSWTCGAESTCAFKCGPVDPCVGLDQAACMANPACQPKFGPSACTPDGRICTMDMAYKGCSKKPAASGTVCLSSSSCGAGEHCSTEDGVCNPYGMLAVCAGTCVN